MSSYHGNRPTHTQTQTQIGPISAQCKHATVELTTG